MPYCFIAILDFFHIFFVFSLQNSLVFSRLHAAMAREVRASKLQTDTWRKSLDLATSLSEDASRKQAVRISKLEEELRQARDEHAATMKKFKDQKEAADAANKSADEARKAVDELKMTVFTWDRAYQDL